MSVWSAIVAQLCSLGRHSAAPAEVWNRGYFFTTCQRCGQSDPHGVGQVARAEGKAVVWKPRKPRGRRPGD